MFRHTFNKNNDQIELYKRCIVTDLNDYIQNKASILGDNHSKRATAVITAVQKVNNMVDLQCILQNQLDLLQGKQPDNIEDLLDRQFSSSMKNKSQLNAFSAPVVQLGVANVKEPSTYHDFISKHHEIVTNMSKMLTPVFNMMGCR